MGRAKQKVHEYNSDGSFNRSFESVSEFARVYNLEKNISHRLKRIYNDVIYVFKDNRLASLRKIGRTGVRDFYRWYNSSINKEKGRAKYDYYYELYDMYGDKVATFATSFHLYKITGIDVRNRFIIYNDADGVVVKMTNGIDVKRIKYNNV